MFDANYETMVINATSGWGWNGNSLALQPKSIKIDCTKFGTEFSITIANLTEGGFNRCWVGIKYTGGNYPFFVDTFTSASGYSTADKAFYFGYNGVYNFKPYSPGPNAWFVSYLGR
jgi:hypothetical protein